MDDCSGRSPDLRVDAPFRLPGENPSGLMEGSSPPTVAGAVADLASRETSPHSHLADLSSGEPERAHHQNKTASVNVAQCGLTRLRCASSVASGSARKGYSRECGASTSWWTMPQLPPQL